MSGVAVTSCKQCGCSEIDTDPSRGDAVCTNCGFVLEESIIVSEVTFEEDGHGRASAVGQFVSSESRGGGGIGASSGGFHSGVAKESRELTLRSAKKKITEIAQQLRLNQHCIDVAFNFFKMALHKQLTKGRKNSLTIAACIYMTCRIEGTPHLLIDFSDVVQMDVYALGRAYVQISRALYINIPAVDPCMYILRFAHKFELGEQTHDVAMTALRLVQRMKRDWIHLGRRPSGLCGAALLIAARLHKFSRSVQDVIRVVKVHETTLRKRLVEFGETPSSSLTLDEFMSVDLEEEHDPPSFKAARLKDRERLQKLLDDEVSAEFLDIQKRIEEELDKRRKKALKSVDGVADSLEPESFNKETEDASKFIMESTMNAIHSIIKPTDNEHRDNNVGLSSDKNLGSVAEKICDIDRILMPPPAPTSSLIVANSAVSVVQPNEKVVPSVSSLPREQINPVPKIVKAEKEEENGDLDLDGIDDDEINGYLMNSQEVQRKTLLWEKLNSDYITQQKIKQEQMEKEKLEGKPEKKKKKKNPKPKSTFQAKSANEAIKIMLTERKMSSKINYDVLKTLTAFNTDGNQTEEFSSSSNTPGTSSSVLDSITNSTVEPFTVIESGPVVPRDRKRNPSISSKDESIILPKKAKNSRKRKVSITLPGEGKETTVNKPSLFEPAPTPENAPGEAENSVVVESGPVLQPVTSNAAEDEDNYSEDEGEETISASQLLNQFRGGDASETNYDEEDFY